MFHQLVLLTDGKVKMLYNFDNVLLQHRHTDTLMQVAYHDAPDKAYEVFLGAITTKYLEQRLVIPSLVEAHNPAGKVKVLKAKQ